MNKNFRQKFEEILKKTYLLNNATTEENSIALAELNNLVKSNIPEKLFRFRKCNTNNFTSLQCGYISTCVASEFSDKYDSLIYVDRNRLSSQFANSLKNDILPTLLNAVKDGNIDELLQIIYDKKHFELIKEDLSNYSIDTMEQYLRDFFKKLPDEIIQRTRNYIDSLRNDNITKIACFTENIYSLNMWDLYADGYKGFALEYDFRDFHTKNLCFKCKEQEKCINCNYSNLCPVIYTNQRYDATDNVVVQIVQDMLDCLGAKFSIPKDFLYYIKPYLFKNEEYIYEKEWRFLSCCPSYSNERFAYISDLGCLKAIY